MTITTWGTPSQVNTTADQDQADPRVAVLRDGSYVIVWQDDDAAGLIRFQRFDATGQRIGDEELVSGDNDNSDPSVVALRDGGFAIVLSDPFAGQVSDHDLNIQVYSATGVRDTSVSNTWDGTGARDSELSETIATFTDTTLATVFMDESSTSGDIVLFQRDISTNTEVSRVTVNTQTVGRQADADVVQLNNGSLAVVWLDINGTDTIQTRVFQSNGTTAVSAQTQVNTGTSSSGLIDNGSAPEILALSNGGYAVAWTASSTTFPYGGDDIRMRIFRPEGTAYSSEILVNADVSGAQGTPQLLSLEDGTFLAMWKNSTDGIVGRVFGETGTALSGDIVISSDRVNSYGFDDRNNFDAARMPDGRIIVTWGDQDGHIQQAILDPRDGAVNSTASETGYGQTLMGHDVGSDVIIGDHRGDLLQGLGGSDALHGAEGSDHLVGGNGDDRLTGGQGDDRLTGGGNAYDFQPDGSRTAVGDFNGDGMDDLVVVDQGGHFDLFLSDGGRLLAPSSGQFSQGALSPGDILQVVSQPEGDTEALFLLRDGVQMELSAGFSNRLYQFFSRSFSGTNVAESVVTGDFDGDGDTDALDLTNGSVQLYNHDENGLGTSISNWGTGFTSDDQVADFNGDGLDDVIQQYNGTAYVYLSNGTTFDAYTQWGTGFTTEDQFADFTGDGNTDVLQRYSGRAYLYESNGTDAFDPYHIIGRGIETGNGAGNDAFVFTTTDFGHDVITDFQAGVGLGDIIELQWSGIQEFADLAGMLADNANGDAVLTLDAGNSITFAGVTSAQLDQDDFLFL